MANLSIKSRRKRIATKINVTLARALLSYVVRARKCGTDGKSYIKSRGVEAERKYINLLGEIVSLNSYYESFCRLVAGAHKSPLH